MDQKQGQSVRKHCTATLKQLYKTHTHKEAVHTDSQVYLESVGNGEELLEDSLKAKYECDRDSNVPPTVSLSHKFSNGLGTLYKGLLAASQSFPTHWWFRQ